MYHPVPVKSGDKTCGVRSDLLSFVTELEKCSVAVDEPGRVGEGDAEVEGLDELEVGMAELENVDLGGDQAWFMDIGKDIYLQDVCEVD